MLERIRLLPVVIVAASLLLGVKVGSIWLDVERLVGISAAYAQATNAESKPPGETKSGSEGEPAAAAKAEPKRTDPRALPIVDGADQFSQAEIEVLQNLSKRREELEARTKELDMREKLLQAAEKRIDGKISELKKIEATVRALLGQHDEEEERQLKSLVKVYEKMKPKDAARILEKLDMDILIAVTERMREAKVAPIMAQMNSAKAKALTVELATRRKLPVTINETAEGG